MTNDHKPPMFGPSSLIDLTSYEPRSGKSFWYFADKDAGHTVLIAPTRNGMSAVFGGKAVHLLKDSAS